MRAPNPLNSEPSNPTAFQKALGLRDQRRTSGIRPWRRPQDAWSSEGGKESVLLKDLGLLNLEFIGIRALGVRFTEFGVLEFTVYRI